MATKKVQNNCIQQYKDMAGEWRWRAVARNGKIIADSAESYVNKANCKRAAVAFKRWTKSDRPIVELGAA
jgi:uncharacterized protein